MNFFEAIDINKSFANHRALTNVSITVPRNSIFGLLGPNGAGKTTLIRIINQITAPDSGQLFFDGKPLGAEHIAQIGYLPEERGLYKKMKVGEQLIYLARLKGLTRHDAVVKIKYWLQKFDLMKWFDRSVDELSKGMQQKIQFIVTIIHNPRLLIFDEPFSGFDPINVNMLKEEILNLKKEGATIIFSTHNMASVEELCDHIALINKSNKILDGKVSTVRAAYKSNTFDVTVEKNNNTNYRQILAQGFELLEEAVVDNTIHLKIKIGPDNLPNDLLNNLINHTQIHNFSEVIPSMNDIFISRVNNDTELKKAI